jgi:hypothetical protein
MPTNPYPGKQGRFDAWNEGFDAGAEYEQDKKWEKDRLRVLRESIVYELLRNYAGQGLPSNEDILRARDLADKMYWWITQTS